MKKAQITLYVILGLLIFGVVALGFYFSTKTTVSDVKDEVRLDFTQQDLNNIIDSCLESIALQTIDEYGLCEEKYFKQEVNKKLAGCIDFSTFEARDFDVKAKSTPDQLNVGITSDNLVIRIRYPIELSKGNKKVTFYETEFNLPRETRLSLKEGKTQRERILRSSDLDFEIKIPRGTQIDFPSDKNQITIYMKEVCPDDPSVLGNVNYQLSPDGTVFSPYAFITVNYEEDHVSRLSREEIFKIAVLEDNAWKFLQSSSDVEENRISTTTTHFSEFSASCLGSNKYGIQLFVQDIYSLESPEAVLDKNLVCAKNFSGSCGFVKLISYLEPEIENPYEYYRDTIFEIYNKELFPLVTLKQEPAKNGVFAHPGECTGGANCALGENKNNEDKPVYTYSSQASKVVNFVERVHADNPQWPLFIEIWEEPNLANNWNNISLTDYQIAEYARYFATMSNAINSLQHANSIEVMPAGLAPTKGQKECVVDPAHIKNPTTIDADSNFEPSFCKLGKLRGRNSYVSGDKNLCQPNQLPSNPNLQNCGDKCISSDDPPGCNSNYEQCIDDNNKLKRQFVLKVKEWYDAYGEKDVEEAFLSTYDLSDESDYGNAQLVRDRIKESFLEYCYEKITEVPPDEFLTKMIQSSNGEQVCNLMEMYADHSYPSVDDIDTYPGGENPFGMEAYKSRFELVRSLCQDQGSFNIECTPADFNDADDDGIKDVDDNCPQDKNTNQVDFDADGLGDACDDSDSDGKVDSEDLCPKDADVQEGTDSDGDGWADSCDNCPNEKNHDQKDLDEDGIGDACDEHTDSDGIINPTDNCPYEGNPSQQDSDGDGVGDACDNCPSIVNPDQNNLDNDGSGDACDDSDGDGFHDDEDNCPQTPSDSNVPEVCQPSELCIGKIMITETAWAPHHSIDTDRGNFNVNNYVEQMSEAYETWTQDVNVMAVIPFHLGGSQELIPVEKRNYSWTEKICSNSCIGKNIFNEISEKEVPVRQCGGNPPKPGDKCVNLSIRVQNLGSDVGSNKVVYKCYACDTDGTYDEPPRNPTKTEIVGGTEYVYYGVEDCFEETKELPELCPDSDGTVREGINSVEVSYGGEDYIAMALCEPSVTSNTAHLHICGTVKECDFNVDNCYQTEGGYGDRWHGCIIPD